MTNSIGHGAAALLQDQHAKELVQREIRLLQRLQACPNVVRYVDSQLQPGSGGRHKMEALILMEFCSGNFRTHGSAESPGRWGGRRGGGSSWRDRPGD